MVIQWRWQCLDRRDQILYQLNRGRWRHFECAYVTAGNPLTVTILWPRAAALVLHDGHTTAIHAGGNGVDRRAARQQGAREGRSAVVLQLAEQRIGWVAERAGAVG